MSKGKRVAYMDGKLTAAQTLPTLNRMVLWLIAFIAISGLFGCAPAAPIPGEISLNVIADGNTTTLRVPAGSTVNDVIKASGLVLSNLDRINPGGLTIAADQMTIRVIRVREEFEIEESILPFQNQKVFNESLPDGQTLLIQPGQNGVEQITYRIVFEDEVEISRSVFKTTVVSEPQPEIIMVGVQTPYTAVTLSGRLVYLTAGNAWIMETTTGNRRPLVTTGDLDGRIFSLSANGNWLLFSRSANQSAEESAINSLWAVNVEQQTATPVSLRVENVIHFADWIPGRKLTIAYSTVEPRSVAPGWQANNDLQILTFNSDGVILNQEEVIESNAGGIYGWWGTVFEWSQDGELLAFARPDSIGLVNFEEKRLDPLIELIPLQTRSDWAWVPDIHWSPDRSAIFSITHKPLAGLASDETSPLFDLTALLPDEDLTIDLVPQTGMFSAPVPSPFLPNRRYQLAYLQAIFSEQSETSRYRLVMMDHDGSNRRVLFPPEGVPGLEPQRVKWGYDTNNAETLWIAFVYQGNLWLINTGNNQTQQITGDGSITRIDWISSN